MNSSRRRKQRQVPTDPFVPPQDLSMRDAAEVIYGGADLGEKGIIRAVTLDEITIDPKIQVRVDGLEMSRVEQYTEFLLAGGQFKDPIVLYRDGDDLLLAAGFHRCASYQVALNQVEQTLEETGEVIQLEPLRAEIRDGGREAAIEFAEEDNLTHGLELRTKDKRLILERRFERGHEWTRLSNRALAAKLGVDHKTISNWRRNIEGAPGENSPGERVGADGKTYDVSGIREANRRRADEQRQPEAESAPDPFEARRERLIQILREGGEIAPSQLRLHSGMDFAAYNETVEQLIEDGIIERRQDVIGGRVTYCLAGSHPVPADAPEWMNEYDDSEPEDLPVDPEVDREQELALYERLKAELMAVADMPFVIPNAELIGSRRMHGLIMLMQHGSERLERYAEMAKEQVEQLEASRREKKDRDER